MSGSMYTLGAVGALALAGLAKRHGAKNDDDDVILQGEARVSSGSAMWAFMSEKVYGSNVDLPVVATREALQNARDAIDKAYKEGKIDKDGGRFEVETAWEGEGYRITWRDNGVGMSNNVVFNKFLDLLQTTKTSGESAGGFGIAKAVILGVSKTFRWTLRTRDYTYRANGIHEKIYAEKTPYKEGVELTVHDVDPMYGSWYTGHGYRTLDERLRTMLAANTLAPKGRHAGVRIFLNGEEVRPFFVGRAGKVLVDAVETDPKTSITVKAWPTGRGEAMYVRLDGLLQFIDPIYGEPGYNLTVDISTRLAPSERGYPLVASRQKLDGETERRVREISEELAKDTQTATKEPDEVELLGVGEEDPDALEQELVEARERLDQILASADFQARLRLIEGGASTLRELEQRRRDLNEQIEDAREQARIRRQQRAKKRDEESSFYDDAPPRPPPPVESRSETGVSLRALRALRKKKEKPAAKPRPKRANPYAGFAVVKVNRREYPYSRLRPFLEDTGRWIPVALAWRITIQLILAQLDRSRPFEVGFVFDSRTRAQIEYGGNRPPVIYINPEWLAGVIKAYKGRPLNIAAVLHSKACHEVAHLLAGSNHQYHGETFVSYRENVADETAGALYPIAGLVESLLGVKPALTPEAAELDKLRRQLERIKARGSRNVAGSRVSDGELAELRQRLVGHEDGGHGCGSCRASGSRASAGLVAVRVEPRRLRMGGSEMMRQLARGRQPDPRKLVAVEVTVRADTPEELRQGRGLNELCLREAAKVGLHSGHFVRKVRRVSPTLDGGFTATYEVTA